MIKSNSYFWFKNNYEMISLISALNIFKQLDQNFSIQTKQVNTNLNQCGLVFVQVDRLFFIMHIWGHTKTYQI